MDIIISEENLPLFEAFASSARLGIIELLSLRSRNIKELADELNLSSAIVTKHIQKMEEAGLVKSVKSKRDGKVCSLVTTGYSLVFPNRNTSVVHDTINLAIGQYFDVQVEPTCGIALKENIIGSLDDPKYFFSMSRINAQLLWFKRGYVEYRFLNCKPQEKSISHVIISAEMGSEYPNYKNDGESDIEVLLNGESLCLWRAPDDFGDRRGKLTPSWWVSNQYGMLKKYEINAEGTYLEKVKQSEKTLKDYHLEKDVWTLRFAVSEERMQAGGLALFGKEFGDYPQDICIDLYYDNY